MSIQYNDGIQDDNNKGGRRYDVAEENRRRRGEKKEEMLKLIVLSEPNGLSTPELQKRMHCHPDTVLRLGKELKSEGKVFKTGKFGKYRITSKAIGSPEITGFLFGSKAMGQFYHLFDRKQRLPGPEDESSTLRQEWISANNKFCNNDYFKTIALGQPHHGIIPDKDLKDELCLFEFAIRIGGIITYEMIQALKYGSSPILGGSKVTINKDVLAWKWVDKVIKPDLILNAFADSEPVWRILKRNKKNAAAADHQPKGPLYEVDKEADLKQLVRSFGNIFPGIYDRLENIMEGIPGEIELIRNHVIEHTSSSTARKLSS